MLFVHGAHVGRLPRPLTNQPAFSTFQRVRYHRRGTARAADRPEDSVCRRPTSLPSWITWTWTGAHVIGHSEGAMIALVLAASYPDRVRSSHCSSRCPRTLACCQRLRRSARNTRTSVRGDGGAPIRRATSQPRTSRCSSRPAWTGARRRKPRGLTSSTKASRTRQRSLRRTSALDHGLRGRAGSDDRQRSALLGTASDGPSTPRCGPSSWNSSRGAKRSSSRMEITSPSPRTQRPWLGRSPSSSHATARPPRSSDLCSLIYPPPSPPPSPSPLESSPGPAPGPMGPWAE